MFVVPSSKTIEFVLWLEVTNQDGYEAIHLAAMNGHVSVLPLFSVHISIDTATSRGETPLMLAAKGGHVSAIKWLVTNGASITMENWYSKSGQYLDALKLATFCGHDEAVHTLLGYTQQEHASRLTDDYFCDLVFLAARKRHMDILATIIERIRSLYELSYLLTVLKRAETNAQFGQLLDTAQLLSSLIASVNRSRSKMSPQVQDETHYPCP